MILATSWPSPQYWERPGYLGSNNSQSKVETGQAPGMQLKQENVQQRHADFIMTCVEQRVAHTLDIVITA